MAKYDIFISYRREGGYDTAKHLYDLLTRDGYRVSFDIDTLRNGDFDVSLLKRIEECRDFILIIDAHAFDRTLNPKFDPRKDWLRQELAYAIKKGKNIIPIFLNGVKGFPDNLPVDISAVAKKNGPEYNRYYFNDFYETIKTRFLSSKPKNKIRRIAVMLILAIVIMMGFVLVDISDNSQTDNYSTDIVSSNDQVKETDSRTKLMKFCGSYSYTVPNAGYGGINYVYDLVLDPITSNVSIVEEGIVNITNSIGYYGTMMQWPEFWNVINFSLNKNGQEAVVQMIGGDNNICDVKLELDEYNNIIMSFISGNEGPSILLDDSGESYSNTVVFKKNQ